METIYCTCGVELETEYELEHGECSVCRMREGHDRLYANWEWHRCEGCVEYLRSKALDQYDCDENECYAHLAPCCNQTTMKDFRFEMESKTKRFVNHKMRQLIPTSHYVLGVISGKIKPPLTKDEIIQKINLNFERGIEPISIGKSQIIDNIINDCTLLLTWGIDEYLTPSHNVNGSLGETVWSWNKLALATLSIEELSYIYTNRDKLSQNNDPALYKIRRFSMDKQLKLIDEMAEAI